jgi:hypothetical protein
MDSRELVDGVRQRVESTWVYAHDGYVPSIGGQLRAAAIDARTLCDALEEAEKERERLQGRLDAAERALAKGRYLDTEIIAEWPEVTLAEVMWEIAVWRETGYRKPKRKAALGNQKGEE